MTVDGVEIDSVNGAMDRSRWPANRLVHVTEYGEAMALLQGSLRQRRVRVWLSTERSGVSDARSGGTASTWCSIYLVFELPGVPDAASAP